MAADKPRPPKERLEYFYSIALLVVIPLMIVANTLIMAVAVRRNFDTELRRKAALANSLIADAVTPDLKDGKLLQKEVASLVKANSELKQITVAAPVEGQQFKVLASTDNASVGKTSADIQTYAAVTNRQAVAQNVSGSDGERLWRVVSPVMTGTAVSAAITTDVSSREADLLVGRTLLQSLGIVGATVILTILLLLNHFKFAQYAILFRKQQEVDQLKNDFLSVATHELRAPMTVIKGNIENLTDGITGKVDERGKAALQTMWSETERLNNLVTDLLNVSRLEQGRISYTFETFDAGEVARTLSDQFQPKAQEKDMTVSYDAPKVPAFVNADRGRLVEIMTNLIDNAIKYSRQGTVSVSHKDDDQHVRLSVRDTGIGMSAKDRERLFSRFYRIQNDATHGIPGTGLGLWIIKQYIEAMHGTISVDSMEGVGTEFIVEFPRASAPSAAGAPLAPADAVNADNADDDQKR